jgi:transcription elongation factor Elf1
MPDANTPSLLPCPFCGSVDVGYSSEDGHDFVVCSNCGTEGPFGYKTGIAAWNQRSSWQPIETAPKDGAKFLAWDGEELLVAWRYEGRWIYDQEMESPYLTHWGPTHWQPLPSPPITPNPHA